MRAVRGGRLPPRAGLAVTLPRGRRLACYSDRRFTLYVPEGTYPAAMAPCPEGGPPWLVLVREGLLVGIPPEAARKWNVDVERTEPEDREDSHDDPGRGGPDDSPDEFAF